MQEDLNKLYDQIYNDNSSKEPRNFIQTVEQKLAIIEKADYSDREDNKKATRLLADYSIMLFNAGYLKKSLPYLNNAIIQIEHHYEDIKDNNLWDDPLYEGLIWSRGQANFMLGNMQIAKSDLKNLVNHNPENDKYKTWLKACSNRKLIIIEWIFAVIALTGIVLSFTLETEDGIINILAIYGMIIGLVGGLSATLIRNRRLKIK